MRETLELKVEPRSRFGKGAAYQSRKSGLIPGIVYGGKADPQAVQVVTPPGQQVVGDDVEQEADLVGGTVPVLGGEGVDGEPGDPELEGALGGVEEGLLSRPVPLGPLQTPLLCPPAVSVHDTGHVDRHAMRVEPFSVVSLMLWATPGKIISSSPA